MYVFVCVCVRISFQKIKCIASLFFCLFLSLFLSYSHPSVREKYDVDRVRRRFSPTRVVDWCTPGVKRPQPKVKACYRAFFFFFSLSFPLSSSAICFTLLPPPPTPPLSFDHTISQSGPKGGIGPTGHPLEQSSRSENRGEYLTARLPQRSGAAHVLSGGHEDESRGGARRLVHLCRCGFCI